MSHFWQLNTSSKYFVEIPLGLAFFNSIFAMLQVHIFLYCLPYHTGNEIPNIFSGFDAGLFSGNADVCRQ